MTLPCKLATSRVILRKTNVFYSGLYQRYCLHGQTLQHRCLSKRRYLFSFWRHQSTKAMQGTVSTAPIRNLLKDSTKKSELKRLLSLAAPEKWRLASAIGFLIVSSSVTMAVPFCLGKVIDVIYTADKEKTKENLNRLTLALLGVFIVGGICNFARVYLMSTASHRITQALRKKVYASILSQETAMFDKCGTGELVGRLTGDAQLVSYAITSNISDGLRSGIMTIAGVSMMFYVSPPLALIGLSIVPPVAAMAVLYGRFVKKISTEVQDSLAQLNTTAEERIANIRTVKAFAQERNEIERYGSKLRDLLALCYKESLYRGIFFGMTGLSGNAIILSVLYYGGIMVSDSAITVGNLSAFLLYAAYIGVSMGGLSSFYSELNKALGASTRLFELIDRVPSIRIRGGTILDRELTGDIIFRNISFSYPTRKESCVLNHFDLHVPKCSVTAIVGPSGSGKSTVASLLLRLYDPNAGCILLDDCDLKDLDPTWVKSQVGTVSQEPVLFSGTIRENILYGAESATEDDLLSAATQANVLEFTEKMTDGLDTIVGERGVTLSGGQRQRVAIARALVKLVSLCHQGDIVVPYFFIVVPIVIGSGVSFSVDAVAVNKIRTIQQIKDASSCKHDRNV